MNWCPHARNNVVLGFLLYRVYIIEQNSSGDAVGTYLKIWNERAAPAEPSRAADKEWRECFVFSADCSSGLWLISAFDTESYCQFCNKLCHILSLLNILRPLFEVFFGISGAYFQALDRYLTSSCLHKWRVSFLAIVYVVWLGSSGYYRLILSDILFKPYLSFPKHFVCMVSLYENLNSLHQSIYSTWSLPWRSLNAIPRKVKKRKKRRKLKWRKLLWKVRPKWHVFMPKMPSDRRTRPSIISGWVPE